MPSIEAKDYRAALDAVKRVLPDCGFYPGGDNGPGDAECHAIDKALNTDAMLRNIIFNVEQAPERHTVSELLTSIRDIVGLQPGERP